MDVAKVVGISESALAVYEAGEKLPRDEIKKRLADFYGLPIGDLFPSSENLLTHSHAPEFLLAIEVWDKSEAFTREQKEKLLRILETLLSPGGADRLMVGGCQFEEEILNGK